MVAGRKAAWEELLGPLKETRVAAVKEDDTLERWGGIFSTIQVPLLIPSHSAHTRHHSRREWEDSMCSLCACCGNHFAHGVHSSQDVHSCASRCGDIRVSFTYHVPCGDIQVPCTVYANAACGYWCLAPVDRP